MKKLASWLLLSCVALMLAACGANTSPEKVAEKYVYSLYAGDAETALKLIQLPDDEKKEAGVEDMVRGKVKAMVAQEKAKADAKGGVKNIVVSPAEYSDENTRAQVKVTISFKKDENSENDTVRLIKTDDGWKIFL